MPQWKVPELLQTRPGTAKLKEEEEKKQRDLRSYILDGLSDHSGQEASLGSENSARLHREEMLGNLPSAHLKVYSIGLHSSNHSVTTQVFTKKTMPYTASRSQETKAKTDFVYSYRLLAQRQINSGLSELLKGNFFHINGHTHKLNSYKIN